MMTTVITRNPPKSTLQLHKPVFWLSSKYYVNENFDVFNWVWDGTVVRLPRAEAKLLSGRGGEGAKKYSAPPPPQIFLHLWVWIWRHLNFQSTDKPLLNRTEQQFNFCDPFQILPSSPTPIHIQIQKQSLKSLRPLFPWIEFHAYFQLIGIFILFSF